MTPAQWGNPIQGLRPIGRLCTQSLPLLELPGLVCICTNAPPLPQNFPFPKVREGQPCFPGGQLSQGEPTYSFSKHNTQTQVLSRHGAHGGLMRVGASVRLGMCYHPRSLSPSITASRDPLKPLPPPRVYLMALNVPTGCPQVREMPWGVSNNQSTGKKARFSFFIFPSGPSGEAKRKPPSGAHLPLTTFRTSANFHFWQKTEPPSRRAPPPPPSPTFHLQPLEPECFVFIAFVYSYPLLMASQTGVLLAVIV